MSLNVPKRILLGPGPSMVAPRILEAMSKPLVGHLDPWFLTLMDENQELLRKVFGTKNKLTVPISGTGSAAMETAIANTIEPGDKALFCINGYFGERLMEMGRRYGAEVHAIHIPWGDIFSPDQVEEAMKTIKPKVVAIVHAETSTGACQPIHEIAKVVHKYDGILIVDAVTSLGGVPVEVDKNEIDVCYSGTQKCLGCPPGLGPITFGDRALDKLANRKTPVSSWYLDLTMLQKYWGKERTYHHTAPISDNYALNEGLHLIFEEGLEQRWARHKNNAEYFWKGLGAMGLECHVPEDHRLYSLTTIKVPEGVDEANMRKRLLEDYNIEISGGLGELKGKVWRVGLMGYSSNIELIDTLLNAMKEIL